MYPTIRTVHRLLASLCLPFLLMYGVSAVQMSHGAWFTLTPAVRESVLSLPPDLADARAVARAATARANDVRGELTSVVIGDEMTLRLVLPGTVHELRYRRQTGETRVKTSVSGAMGMLNRLHHAAGLWHEARSMRLWGVAVAVVSVALLLLGASGIWMWFVRRSEQRLGIVLLAMNVAIAVGLLVAMRLAGP